MCIRDSVRSENMIIVARIFTVITPESLSSVSSEQLNQKATKLYLEYSEDLTPDFSTIKFKF